MGPALAVAVLLVASLSVLGANRHTAAARHAAHKARVAMDAANARLATTQRDLQTTVAQRDDLKSQLATTQSSLTDAKSSIESQGGQIEVMKTCLNDIKALGEALRARDTSGISQQANATDRDCLKAEAFL